MGNGVMCAATQKSGVAQGDANTPKNSCATTTTPKRGVGGGGAAPPVRSRGGTKQSCKRDGEMHGRDLAKTKDEQFRASWGLQTMLINVGVY